MRAPIRSISREEVIASLEGIGSSDPEVLAAAKEILAGTVAPPRAVAVAGLVLGIGIALTPLGVIGGAPLVGLGIWGWLTAVRSRKSIEDGYAEFVRTPSRASSARGDRGGSTEGTWRNHGIGRR